jgi:monofunctional biosynthetic peptidoglycan transglycosylase
MAAIAALMGVRFWAIGHIESKLQAHGIDWERRVDAPAAIRWHGLSGPGLQARMLEARAMWPARLILRDVTVDPIASGLLEDTERVPSGAPAWSPPVEIHTSGLSIHTDTVEWFAGMSGELWPQTQLTGTDSALRMETDEHGHRQTTARTQIDLNGPLVWGEAKVEVQIGSLWRLRVEMENASLKHTLLARSTLGPVPMAWTAVWDPSKQALAIDGDVGGVNIVGTGHATAEPPNIDLKWRVPLTPLADISLLFGGRIPESEHALITGQLGASGRLSGPPWAWTLAPKAVDLGAKGVLPGGFQRHAVQWMARDASGEQRVQQTGAAHPDWTRLREAGHMPAAVMAAEDIGFADHSGVDLAAIGEALSAAQLGKPLRGGSTLTQQLAKNLFLNNERTLVRKLRELLYALNLEHMLSKDDILALYLNVVEFGPGIYGIKAAADAYFLKSPDQLSLAEAAFLASILPAPRTAWVRAREKGAAKRWPIGTILDRLSETGARPASEIAAARTEKLRFVVE